MKSHPFLYPALAFLVLGGALPLPALSDSPAPAAGESAFATRAQDWQDCAALEKRLAKAIIGQLKGIDKASLQAFLATPANRLMLAQWYVAHRENAEDFSKLASAGDDKTIPPRNFAELLSGGDADTAETVRILTNNVNWMEKLAYSGECIRPGRALAIMDGICRDEKLGMKRSFLKDRVLLSVATATALEWARSNWDYHKAIDRARFYMQNHADKRFHKGFASLPFWQYRVICGSKGDNANGSVASLEWALDNVHLPVEQYTGACWYCNYLSDNLFGDSIHGSHYYAPYDDVYGANALQRSREIGGVCGSLSHFGAFAAIANGVPALPAGEPGHCAYIVCVNGKWVPAYSLSWERGLHWQVWNGNYKYSSLPMASELYSAEQTEKTALSEACRTLGELFASVGEKKKAHACFRASVTTQPLNYLAWCNYAGFLNRHMADNTAAWKLIYRELSTGLAPRYPEMAAEILLGRVHAPMHKACPSTADRMTCYKAFWKSVKGMGPDRWAVEHLCNSQAGSLQDAKRNETEAKLAFYTMALGYTANNAAYAPIILSWGNNAAAKLDAKTQNRFLKATLTGLSKGGKMEEGARDSILNQAILGAERMRDRTSFQTIGNMLPEKYRKNRLPKWEPFPGKLVSRGGMLYASSTCQHDWPCEHWGVLEPTGGRFHTGADKDAWVVVELPKMAHLSGVVTISQSNNWRLTGLKVQYSESGRDDDWHEAGAMPNPTGANVNRLDLQQSKPRARFIRIVRPGGPEVFQLNGIFVYGKPAA